MTKIDKEGFRNVETDLWKMVTEDVHDQAVLKGYQVAKQEYLLTSDVLKEGGGSDEGFGKMRASSDFFDDRRSRFGKYSGNNSGMYSFPCSELLTKSGGSASSGSSGGGNGSPLGGYVSDVRRSEMLVGGGALSPNSVFNPVMASLYDGRSMNNGGFMSEEEICRYMNSLGVEDVGVEYASELKGKNVDMKLFRLWTDEEGASVTNGGYGDIWNSFGGYKVAAAVSNNGYSSSYGVGGGMLSPALSSAQKGNVTSNLFQPQFYPRNCSTSFPPVGYSTLPARRQNLGEQAAYTYGQDTLVPNFYTNHGFAMPDSLYSATNNRMNLNGGDGILDVPNIQQVMQRPSLNISSELRYGLSHCRSRMPQCGYQDINQEGSFILQGEGMSTVSTRNANSLRRHTKGSVNGVVGIMLKGKHTHQDRRSKMPGTNERYRNQQLVRPVVIPCKIGSLEEVRGYLYYVAKDQTGCRFLQNIVEQRNPQVIQVIFDEIIEHVAELMINPFGNYLMQKLLDACTKEQITQIIDVVTKEPGKIVRVSMNDHGTRVIQKLIETATIKEEKQIETATARGQIEKIVSALQPGLYALIKDSNGIHVIERCLLCFSNEDNKFIFDAVIEYRIDIATDQSGCCVLQKCIGHSSAEYRDPLVAEISSNAFLLSQDAFGNYVVQFILDMKNQLYNSWLISQFRGNYAHLAMQKCSSHVVEKCLNVFNDHDKSQIIQELVSFDHFEQLVQGPHANYVIQTARRVSDGAIHQLLEEKINLYESISINSPYAKRIFSSKKKR